MQRQGAAQVINFARMISQYKMFNRVNWLPLSINLPLIKSGIKLYQQDGFYRHKDWQCAGVTKQFLKDADAYHDLYFNRLDFQALIDQIIDLAGINDAYPLSVLDIGSGGGSSVFALAKRLSNASVIASDISPQLLGKLMAFVSTRDELKSRISAYCFDIHLPFFKDQVFDLIVGSAILHHLIDPFAALVNVASALKPGGKIVLIEPMEAGHLLLAIIYEQILEFFQNNGQLEHPIAGLMRTIRTDVYARLGVPQRHSWTKNLDDKWVFNRTYLTQLARQLGCSNVHIHPTPTDLTYVFQAAFHSLLSDSGNAGVLILEEVIKILRDFDQGIPLSLKERLCPTGIIVFIK